MLDGNFLPSRLYVIRSDKTSLIAQKYTDAYNGIYPLFCRCYSVLLNCLGFLLACAKILCSERVIKLERLKSNSKFLWQ